MDRLWDERKNRSNRQKHGLSFETAQLVFDDPLAVSVPDQGHSEERWRTIGAIGNVIVLVIHTAPEENRHGRIISARKATRSERRTYEEGAL